MQLYHVLEVVISIIAVTCGAELLVRGASTLALRMGVSPLFVGLTVVGFGTSTPELGASLSATLRGAPDISVGNVVGSNIFNVGVILGLTAMFRPISVSYAAIQKDLRVVIAAGLIPLTGYFVFGAVNKPLGALAVAGLAVYLFAAYRRDRIAQQNPASIPSIETAAFAGDERLSASVLAQVGFIVAGLVLLIGGADRFVHGSTEIARSFGVSELVIGLTIVAAGTSLPELVTSIVAAFRKNSDMAVGNIVGSNIFNLLGILGVCALFAPQPMQDQSILLHIGVMMSLSILLFPLIKSGGLITRWEGTGLLTIYLGYMAIIGYQMQL